MDELVKAIATLLQALFPTDYAAYTNTSGNSIVPIFHGYDNKIVPPNKNNYVIITSISDENMSLGFMPVYDSATQKNTYYGIMSTLFFIDMYGDKAENNARVLNALCQNGYANTYFRLNNYSCSVHKAKAPRNLTDTFGREMYNKRFLVELELFNNVSQAISIPNFTSGTINLTWAP